jgi:hypothetical protein
LEGQNAKDHASWRHKQYENFARYVLKRPCLAAMLSFDEFSLILECVCDRSPDKSAKMLTQCMGACLRKIKDANRKRIAKLTEEYIID